MCESNGHAEEGHQRFRDYQSRVPIGSDNEADAEVRIRTGPESARRPVAFLMVADLSYAKTSLPDSVTISTGESVIFENGRVFITRSSDKHMIELPTLLNRALRDSDEVVFPEAMSRRVDGKDVILIIVVTASSPNPVGYCGAGLEANLYAVELRGTAGKVIFYKKVGSCLDSINMNDNGVDSRFKAIKWVNDSADVSISWARDEAGQARIHIYRINHGKFEESSKNGE